MVLDMVIVWMAVVMTVLAVYALMVLKTMRETLQETRASVDEAARRLAALSEEAAHSMRTVTRIAEDVQTKVNVASSVFAALAECGLATRRIGESLHQVASAVTDTAGHIRQAVHTQQSRIAEIGEWVAAGWAIWQKRQSGRTETSGKPPFKGEEENDERKQTER